ncbi:MAG: hypothetical protein ACLTZT_05680 [Butyricimonas faecalis]
MLLLLGESKAILILSDGTSVNLDRGVDSTDTFIGVAKIKRNREPFCLKKTGEGLKWNIIQ